MHILLSDLAATERLGTCLGAAIGGVDKSAVIALQGPLGAGKTTLVKAVGRALGVTEVVVSPTFTMLNEYHSGRTPLFHLDMYRGGETGETIDLDMMAMELDELIEGGGVAMIEWPQYFICEGRSFFEGRDYVHMHLAYANDFLKEKRPDFFKENDKENDEQLEEKESGSEVKNEPAAALISQAVDNPSSGERFARVLREPSPPEKYIKDGFTESRIATLSANGVSSGQLLAKLYAGLGDMVINL